MKKFLTSLFLGACAGLLAYGPGVIHKSVETGPLVVSLVAWACAGIIIAFCSFRVPSWLRGLFIVAMINAKTILTNSNNEFWYLSVNFFWPAILAIVLGLLIGLINRNRLRRY